MSTDPAAPISLRSPDAVVAAVPYLLGFHPSRSAVVVWSSSVDHRVLLSMRFDLPDERPRAAGGANDPATLREALAELVRRPLPHLPDDAVPVLLVYPAQGPVSAQALPHGAIVSGIVDALAECERPPLDALCVSDGRWWSYLCDADSGCELCGHPIDPDVASEVAAACVLAGLAPVAEREALVVELAPAPPAAIRRVRTALTALAAPMRARRVGDALESSEMRTRCWRALSALALHGVVDDLDDQALVLLGLRDLHHRDAFIALTLQQGVPSCVDALSRLVTLSPRHYRAQPAASVALLRYLSGDGARAWVAVDVALDDDPQCSLAQLVAGAVGSGMPPTKVREVFCAFDPDDLRHRRVEFPAA